MEPLVFLALVAVVLILSGLGAIRQRQLLLPTDRAAINPPRILAGPTAFWTGVGLLSLGLLLGALALTLVLATGLAQ